MTWLPATVPAVSPYVYAANDPLNFTDPLGTWPLPPFVSHLVHRVAHSIDVGRHDIAHGFDIVRHDAAHRIDLARHSVAHGLDVARHDAAHDFDLARHDFAHGLDIARHSIAHGYDIARHDTAHGLAVARHTAAHYGDVAGRWIAKHRVGLTQALLIAGAVALTVINVLQLGLDPVTDAAEGADITALAGEAGEEAVESVTEAGDEGAAGAETEANTSEGLARWQKMGIGAAGGFAGSIANGLANHDLNPVSVLIGTATGAVGGGITNPIVGGMVAGGANDSLNQLWMDRKHPTQFNPVEAIGETLLGGAVGAAPGLDIPGMSDTAQTIYGGGVGTFVTVFDPVELFSGPIWQSVESLFHH
jgi:hypothetical protein